MECYAAWSYSFFICDSVNNDTLCLLQKNGSEEVQKGIQTSLAKLSSSFPESSKAEEWFHKLNLEKDDRIFTTLAQLLDEVNLKSAESTRVSYWIQTLSSLIPKYLVSPFCL